MATARAITRRPNPTTGKPPKRPEAALTPAVRKAVEGMVYKGLGRADAAKYAEMSESALYQAFRKPTVLAHYNAELDVLRTSARARNVHVLEQIRDGSANDMAKVAAIKVLEPERGQPGVQVNVGVSVSPGYVIDLSQPRRGPVIDHQEPEDVNTLSSEQDVRDAPVRTR